MKIVDILIDAACLLGLEEEPEILRAVKEETELQVLEENEKIKSLFNLIQFSIRELCTNYVPVSKNEKITTMDKKYPVGMLDNFIRVQNVYKNQEMVKFKVINRNIIFEEDGDYIVNYSTYPMIVSLFDDIDFLQHFSPDAIVFGLCAYYSLAHGMFDEFEDFHDRYITKADSLKNLRIFEIPSRRWE